MFMRRRGENNNSTEFVSGEGSAAALRRHQREGRQGSPAVQGACLRPETACVSCNSRAVRPGRQGGGGGGAGGQGCGRWGQ